MDNQQAVELIRNSFALVVLNDKTSLVDLLNQNGFPTSYSTPNSDLIATSLRALQLSNLFKKDFVLLMKKQQEKKGKLGFAAQPDGGGMITRLSAKDLVTTVNPMNKQEFLDFPIFSSCKNCNNFI